jgi:Ca2+-transporting ATPase
MLDYIYIPESMKTVSLATRTKELDCLQKIESDALQRLDKDGHNELPSTKKRSIVTIAFDVAREPIFLLLLAGGVIYMLLSAETTRPE